MKSEKSINLLKVKLLNRKINKKIKKKRNIVYYNKLKKKILLKLLI